MRINDMDIVDAIHTLFKGEWLLIEAYSQYTKHHSDLLTLKSLNFLPYDFGRIWAYIF